MAFCIYFYIFSVKSNSVEDHNLIIIMKRIEFDDFGDKNEKSFRDEQNKMIIINSKP